MMNPSVPPMMPPMVPIPNALDDTAGGAIHLYALSLPSWPCLMRMRSSCLLASALASTDESKPHV